MQKSQNKNRIFLKKKSKTRNAVLESDTSTLQEHEKSRGINRRQK